MPRFYEEAAHIMRVLTDTGLPSDWLFPVHMIINQLASELEIIIRDKPSHATAGMHLVDILSSEAVDCARRRARLDAIAGTLVGDFLLMRR